MATDNRKHQGRDTLGIHEIGEVVRQLDVHRAFTSDHSRNFIMITFLNRGAEVFHCSRVIITESGTLV